MSTNALRAPELKLLEKTPTQTKQEVQLAVTTRKGWKAILREIFEGHEEYLGVTPRPISARAMCHVQNGAAWTG